ncbi:GILT-like protein 3 [Nylanderia fulva]|uniref:GILT-like protein 3 n=1 Tax=Nylanderia fulva TaxID=613905 RepID=UPI0010FB9A11|nr:GILT-like protein 3 [Nylanderia fulva]
MGLGNFRLRLVIVFVVGLLLWQTSKIWLAFLQGDLQELQVGQAATALSQKDDPTHQKVHVAVYYETRCPDSRYFIAKQLRPTYQKLPANIEFELIPYGKASTVKTNNGYQFVCQHGFVECEANIIHACSIDVIKDPSIQLQFITCMIENNDNPIGIMQECAKRISVNLESIQECYSNEKGKELLANYGKLTNSLGPRLSFIPAITLDRNFDPNYQAKILKNLLKEVCLHLKIKPKECS